MLRVALVPSSFHPEVGGVEELTRQLAHRLDAPLVISQRWPRDLPAHESFEGLDLHRFAFRTPVGGAKAVATYPVGRLIAHHGLVELLRQAAVDLVHVQCVSATALYAVAAARQLRLPLVVTLQGELTMDATGLYQRSRFMRNVMRRSLREAHAITACSAATLAEGEDFFGAPLGPRASVIHNGIAIADFAAARATPHPRPYVLALGRHVTQKGFDVLLRAWADLPKASHDLVLAGDGPERPALEALAASLGISNSVFFIGFADRAAAVALFQACDAFVLPSRHEPQGIVTLEAMACGKPVIASDVGGVAEIVVDGHTGVLVPAGQPSALTSALSVLLGSRERRYALGAAGRHRAQLFNWDILAESYKTVYQQARTLVADAISL